MLLSTGRSEGGISSGTSTLDMGESCWPSTLQQAAFWLRSSSLTVTRLCRTELLTGQRTACELVGEVLRHWRQQYAWLSINLSVFIHLVEYDRRTGKTQTQLVPHLPNQHTCCSLRPLCVCVCARVMSHQAGSHSRAVGEADACLCVCRWGSFKAHYRVIKWWKSLSEFAGTPKCPTFPLLLSHSATNTTHTLVGRVPIIAIRSDIHLML